MAKYKLTCKSCGQPFLGSRKTRQACSNECLRVIISESGKLASNSQPTYLPTPDEIAEKCRQIRAKEIPGLGIRNEKKPYKPKPAIVIDSKRHNGRPMFGGGD